MMTSKHFQWLRCAIISLLIVSVLVLNACILLFYQTSVKLDIYVKKTFVNPNSEIPPENRIPKIIHLMWSDRLVPLDKLEYVKNWRQNHPNWTIYFWTTSDFDQFLSKKYSNFTRIYRELKQHDQIISRRYFIIHHYGGVWADLDVESLKPLDPLIENQSCLLSQEPEIHAKLGWFLDTMIGSAIFACRPHHPYFRMVLNLLQVNGKDPHTFAATGSVMLSRVYSRYRDLLVSLYKPSGLVLLAEPDVFMPHVRVSYLTTLKKDCDKLDRNANKREPFCRKFRPLGFQNAKISDKSYTVHHWFSNWSRPQVKDGSSTNKRDIFEWMTVDQPTI